MKTAFLKLSLKATLPLIMMTNVAFSADLKTPLMENTAKTLGPQVLPVIEMGQNQIRHTEHAPSAGLPQMDVTWFPSQIFWMCFVFVVLYVVFGKAILPDISATLEKRRNKIQDDLDAAQDLKNSAEQARRDYEHLMAEALEKSSSLFAKAEDQIKKKTAKKIEGFLLRAERETALADSALKEAKISALLEIPKIAAEMATFAAHKIVGIETTVHETQNLADAISLKVA